MLILNTLFIKSIEMLNVNYLSVKLEKHLHYYYIYFNNEYFFIAVFILSSFLVTNLMFFSAFFLSLKAKSFEKSSPYECGFEPFDSNAHGVFNVQYFVVGILFMIFDLEMSYLYCWSIYLGSLPVFSFWVMMFFLSLLVVGFFFEWKKRALDWL